MASSRLFLTFTLSAVAFAATGCGRQPASAIGGGKAGAGTSSAFRVALITSGPTSDNGWNAGAYAGLQLLKSKLGAQVENVEAPTPGAQQENLRAFASQGYNIVIGHGAEYESAAIRMESEFPKTLFVISSGRRVGVNTTPIVLKLEDGAYLEGMLAAGMSKSGRIGAVGAEKIVPLESVFSAYAAGAHAVSPSVIVAPPVFTGDWDDVGKAKQATLALIDQGADVVIQDLDAAAAGVFQAVKERDAATHRIYALGTNSDQNGVAPNVVLASAPINIGAAFLQIAQATKNGTFKPNSRPFDMASGVIGFVINPELRTEIPPRLEARLASTQQAIVTGKLVIPQAN
ncbi:MAG: BMP family protein [Armatimonadetes bacterium]|nr:BMP family protein [Armatimonadota bacterium]MDE2207095.1 BMP family protein [Armatimonadota bacterium]